MSDHVGAKAISLAQGGRVRELEMARVFAVPASDSGVHHVIAGTFPAGGVACSCPAGRTGVRCSHAAAVRLVIHGEASKGA